MKTTKFCVIDVIWNKPPYIPIPVSMHVICKLFKARKVEYSNIKEIILLYNKDLSRLKVTALNNKTKQEEKMSMSLIKNYKALIYIS